MHLLDWLIVAGSLLTVLIVGFRAQRYVNSVADFLAAGRLARRYLLAVSRAEMSSGAAVFAAGFEVFSKSGFVLGWWVMLLGPLNTIVSFFSFVSYRLRETRAMTLAQFFEIRYTKSLRLFAGILGFLAGVVNFGIIPAVGARVMVYFLGLPLKLHVFGLTVPSFALLMAAFLAINLLITLSGGIITIMVTDCIEGVVSQVMYLILIAGILSMFTWPQMREALSHQPPGKSFLNPMDTLGLKDFNIWQLAMGFVLGLYGAGAWQNRSAYAAAPLTAHEGRMSGLMGSLRSMGAVAFGTLLGLGGYTYLHHPDFHQGAMEVQAQLSHLASAQTQEQMSIPAALNHFLPTGMKGALCSVFLLGIFGGDSMHLHSWGSLFVQDVLLPYRKAPLSPAQHIRWLRLAMLGVAGFAFMFGVLVPPSDYIQMWFAVTQGIFTTGAGAVIIGGLYWKKGTAAGSWWALIVGSFFSVIGIGLRQYYGPSFFFNGQQISFFGSIIAMGAYVVVSLLTCREDFNLERMLHRGQYAKINQEVGDTVQKPATRRLSWTRLFGIDENFTRGDKWIAGFLFSWSALFSAIFIVGTIWNLFSPWSLDTWAGYWHVTSVVIPVFFAVVFGVWFMWGGIYDSVDLFRRLRARHANVLDNGMVMDHQNLDESVLPDAASPVATLEPTSARAAEALQ